MTTLKIQKEDFIEILCSRTPEEINKLILEKGKPIKPYWPVHFFKDGPYGNIMNDDK